MGGWVVAALVALLLAVASVPIASAVGPASVVIAVLLSLAGGLSLRHPVVGAVIVGTVLTLGIGHGPPHLGSGILASPVAVAACAARGHLLTAIGMAAWHLIPPTLSALLRGDDPEFLVAQVLLWLVLETTAVLAGTWGRDLARRVHDERTRRISDLAEQRRAIARELHDTGVRAMTRVVMLAESAAARPGIAPTDAEHLARIALTARTGTEELRDLLDILRIEDAAASPIPTPEDTAHADRCALAGLLEGLRLRLAAEGFTARIELEAEESLTVSRSGVLERCLREIEANVVRHGDRGTPIAILGEVRPAAPAGAEIELLLRNGVARHPAPGPAGGAGLDGVRERLATVGGQVETRLEGTGFLTRLLVPLETVAPPGPLPAPPGPASGTSVPAPPPFPRTFPQPTEATP